ncbi:MAG: ATP-binding protein [Cetobacterium sp.]|uniref:ATP-binding protein n=1 Tax=Cetobacterium sp. TaxID=2071632 RepID=UPI003EE5560B
MKLRDNDIEIFSSSNNKKEDAFQILATKAAFDILSNKLYANKPRAIIRELSTNAIDAHRSAGTQDIDYQVHLPTTFEPTFWIRDFGTGIHPDDIRDVFIVYFASTKQDNNDDIGGMGLGCKSPYSYSKVFTVVSFYEGKRYTYEMSIVGGEPKCKEISIIDTDEPNGLMISVPVEYQDFNRFDQEASYVYRTLSKKPKFSGIKSVNTELRISKQYDSFFLTPDYSRGMYALMGGIMYPIKSIGYDRKETLHSFSLREAVVIPFDIGTLDFQPSREELSYEEETIELLHEVLGKIDDEFMTKATEEFQNYTDPRELYRDFIKSDVPSFLRGALMETLKASGKSLSEWDKLYKWDNFGEYKARRIWRAYNTYGAQGQLKASFMERITLSSMPVNGADLRLDGLTLLLMDTKASNYMTFANYLAHEKLITVTNRNMGGSEEVIAISYNDETRDDIQTLIDAWNLSPGKLKLFKFSDHSIAVRDYAKKAGKITAKDTNSCVFKPSHNYGSVYSLNRSNVKFTTADMEEQEFYYCHIWYDDIVIPNPNNDGIKATVSKAVIAEFMKTVGISEIYGIRKSHWKSAKKHGGIDIMDALNDYIASKSGYRVAMKSISKESRTVSNAIRHCPDSHLRNLLTFGSKWDKRKQEVHSDFNLFDCMHYNYLKEDGLKQLYKFRGKMQAYNRANAKLVTEFGEKFPLLSNVLSKYSDGFWKNRVPMIPEMILVAKAKK